MKAAISFLTIILFSVSALAQRTLIVDNTGSAPNGDHVYSDLRTAIEDALSGDIIQIMPSPTAYTTIYIRNKSNIKIVGAGFNTDLVNSNEKGRSIISNSFNFGDGSSGIVVDGVVLAGGIVVENTSNNIVQNCEVDDLILTTTVGRSVSNFIFRNNIILGTRFTIPNNGSFSGGVFENNIIVRASGTRMDTNFSTWNNNLILGHSNGASLHGIENIFNNNIIQGFTGTNETNQMIRSVFNNNLMEVDLGQNDGSSGDNNIVKSFDLPALFDDERIIANEWDRDWDVTSTSTEVVGTASNGGNIGPTGSNSGNPYKKIAFSLPTITELTSPLSVKSGQNFEVTIKAKGN